MFGPHLLSWVDMKPPAWRAVEEMFSAAPLCCSSPEGCVTFLPSPPPSGTLGKFSGAAFLGRAELQRIRRESVSLGLWKPSETCFCSFRMQNDEQLNGLVHFKGGWKLKMGL